MVNQQGEHRLDQVVFRWEGNRHRTGTGITAVAYSCERARAEELHEELAPLLQTEGTAQPSQIRQVRRADGQIVVINRRRGPDAHGRPSTESHALIGSREVLKTRVCLALGRLPLPVAVDGPPGTDPDRSLRTLGRDDLADVVQPEWQRFAARVETVREPLTVVAAQLLRTPGHFMSVRIPEFSAEGTNDTPLLIWGLSGLFDGWLGRDFWTYATYDTTDGHALRVMGVPSWRTSAVESPRLERIALAEAPDDEAHGIAAELVRRFLSEPVKAEEVHRVLELCPAADVPPWQRLAALGERLRTSPLSAAVAMPGIDGPAAPLGAPATDPRHLVPEGRPETTVDPITDGGTSGGIRFDGLLSGGVRADGLLSGGVRSDGLLPDGVRSDGLLSEGVRPDGLPPRDARSDGLSGDVRSDGLLSGDVRSDGPLSDGVRSGGPPSSGVLFDGPASGGMRPDGPVSAGSGAGGPAPAADRLHDQPVDPPLPHSLGISEFGAPPYAPPAREETADGALPAGTPPQAVRPAVEEPRRDPSPYMPLEPLSPLPEPLTRGRGLLNALRPGRRYGSVREGGGLSDADLLDRLDTVGFPSQEADLLLSALASRTTRRTWGQALRLGRRMLWKRLYLRHDRRLGDEGAGGPDPRHAAERAFWLLHWAVLPYIGHQPLADHLVHLIREACKRDGPAERHFLRLIAFTPAHGVPPLPSDAWWELVQYLHRAEAGPPPAPRTGTRRDRGQPPHADDMWKVFCLAMTCVAALLFLLLMLAV
ncbi:hypothetical protein ABZ896_35435 [Streptomyces sp. NPDC047072]|uniref:hypothetical protein n=1 Tax=Streptomyces sp. NPDC047072 TaxID=3154809 RepID=UPI0033E2C1FF